MSEGLIAVQRPSSPGALHAREETGGLSLSQGRKGSATCSSLFHSAQREERTESCGHRAVPKQNTLHSEGSDSPSGRRAAGGLQGHGWEQSTPVAAVRLQEAVQYGTATPSQAGVKSAPYLRGDPGLTRTSPSRLPGPHRCRIHPAHHGQKEN